MASAITKTHFGDSGPDRKIVQHSPRCAKLKVADFAATDRETPVQTTIIGDNADLIREVAKLYLKPGMIVADVTFGRGTFWKKTNTSRFTLLKSDIVTCRDARYDFRFLPYDACSIDRFILDPPYAHNMRTHFTSKQYQGTTVGTLNHNEIIALYRAGIAEAKRVLKPGGQIWIKGKDEIESGKQRRSHIEIFNIALELNLIDQEYFTLVATSRTPSSRWKRQFHARKNESFLWVFVKPPERRTRTSTKG